MKIKKTDLRKLNESLKKWVKLTESISTDSGEKYFVDSQSVDTVLDDYEQGELDDYGTSWGYREIPVKGNFDTIYDALEAVCDANGYDWNPKNWISWGNDFGEDYGRFDGDILVDSINLEADKNDIESWKRGETKLWNAHFVVYIRARTVRDLTPEEIKDIKLG